MIYLKGITIYLINSYTFGYLNIIDISKPSLFDAITSASCNVAICFTISN